MATIDKSKTTKLAILGTQLRELREKKGLLLREVAAEIKTDTAFVSKLERGEKNALKSHILKLAELYRTDPKILFRLWLCEKILKIIKDETEGQSAIELVLKKIKTNS